MTGLRQIVLILSMAVAFFAQSYAGSFEKQIACGAAADSAANRNTETLTRYGSYGAMGLALLTALSSRIPALGNLLGKIGGIETLGRVVDDGRRLVEKRGSDPAALTDLFQLAVEKGVASNPEVMSLLGRLNLHLGDHPPGPRPAGEPPSRDECVSMLVRRIELDAAARVSGTTQPTPTPPNEPPPTIPFPARGAA